MMQQTKKVAVASDKIKGVWVAKYDIVPNCLGKHYIQLFRKADLQKARQEERKKLRYVWNEAIRGRDASRRTKNVEAEMRCHDILDKIIEVVKGQPGEGEKKGGGGGGE